MAIRDDIKNTLGGILKDNHHCQIEGIGIVLHYRDGRYETVKINISDPEIFSAIREDFFKGDD